MQPNDAIRAIKERLNIVDMVRRYVDLKRNGPRWMAPCPFHQETKPSFSVSEDRGMFYCFGCQASGDIFDFYARINGLDFKETLEQLAAEAGVSLEQGPRDAQRAGRERRERSARQQMLRMYELAASHFAAMLARSDEGRECREYIARRGLKADIVERFGLGWAPRGWQSLTDALRRAGHDLRLAAQAGLVGQSESGRPYDRFRGRLMFPIKSLSNQVIAFGGRVLVKEEEVRGKYINTAETPLYTKGEHVYGLAQARRGIAAKGRILLTEGYIDVLTLHQFGYDNAVAGLGTALTDAQVKRLSGFASEFTLLYDGDRAGRKAALHACEKLLVRGLSCSVVLMPDGEDIDSLLRGQGPEAFANLQAGAPDGLRFCVDMLKALAPRETLEWARNFLGQLSLPELVSPYVSRLASQLQLSEAELRQGLAAGRRQREQGRQNGGATLPRQNIRDREILMYAIRYPNRLADMRALGADLALRSEMARELWDKLEQLGPEETFRHLTPREKTFWGRCRGPEAPPLDNGDRELAALRHWLDNYYAAAQKSSLAAALRANSGAGDFEADLEYLRALKETLEKGHEQS